MAEEHASPNPLDSFVESLSHGIDSVLSPTGSFKLWWMLSLRDWVDTLGTWGISRGSFVIGLYVPLFIAANILLPAYGRLLFGWILLALPILGPTAIATSLWASWIWYAQSYYAFKKTDPVLLEVKIPTEVTKSPRAMEQVLTSLWIRMSETTFIDRNYSGGSRPAFSLELASFGGQVHCFIWSKRMLEDAVDSSMYAQYPEVEIVEVEDYAKKFRYDPKKHTCFVTEYRFEPPKDVVARHAENAYPIRTYVDFELDQDPKEEFKVEPFAQVIEALSAIAPEEQAWIQVIIRGHFKADWQKAIEKEVEYIREKSTKLEHPSEADAGFPRPTWRQTEQMRSMERNLGKLPFEWAARGIYIAPAAMFSGATHSAIRWIYRPFSNPQYMNQLRPRGGHNPFDFSWQDWHGFRWRLLTRRYIDGYRRRCAFKRPYILPYYKTSVEVIATIWHPPSSTVKSPGLQRISSKKSEPPPNLPM